SQDPAFRQALDLTKQQVINTNDDFITVFARNYNEISNGSPLAYIFNNQTLREKVSPNSSNEEVIRVLREETESTIASSYNVLRNRIDRFGVTQPNIQRLDNGGRILVELPGVKEPERVRKLLQGTASLEFWATYDNSQIYPVLENANAIIAQLNQASEQIAEVEAEEETVAEESSELIDQIADDAANTDSEAFAKAYPLFSKLSPLTDQTGNLMAGPIVGYAMSYDTAAVNAYLAIPQVKALFPRDLKLMWGVKAIDEAETIFELYAIKANTRDGKAPLDGSVVVEAREEYSQYSSNAEVSMVMNATGSRTWARLTADNIGQCIAIALDGYVYSAPRVNQEITGGRSSITGDFTIQEATDLANVLKSGKLPAPARIIQDTVVGPSLGQESIDASMISFLLAFVLVLLYMIFFYNTAGMVASVALICNVFFLFGVLASFGAVLTLPGIAGIVLTLGMAVDANVIIYERVKEELRAGKGLSLAISEGYKNAMSAIIDSNLTTIITGVVLFFFGTGPVQGFATTLIVGILTSLFTAIFITRVLFTTRLEKNKKIRFSNKATENFLANTNINFINIRKVSYIIASVLVLASVASLATRGMDFGVDFTGGRTFTVRFDKEVTADEVRSALNDVFMSDEVEGDMSQRSVDVKQFGSANQMKIVTQYKYDDQSDDATAIVEELLYTALNPIYAEPITLEEFTSTVTNPNGIVSADMVGPSVASDITRNAFIAVFIALIAIFCYILLRFKKWQWSFGSTVALAHDAFVTIGIFSLLHGVLPFNLTVDQAFIAAILTIIGYSINDKVVIFDRIREYITLYPKRDMKETINSAVNATLARTINTSGTTFVTLLAIFIFGGEVIRGFVFALMLGVIIGTLSSIFIATPIAYDLIRKNQNK
ncbi:MAG: protein translocase subunit SecDF, partial [Tidjanibacter sp.]|nr:protein translocase subunit SecDF [Tidjanibacter sp.]